MTPGRAETDETDAADGAGSGQEMLVAPTMRKDMAMSTTASASEVAVSFSRSR